MRHALRIAGILSVILVLSFFIFTFFLVKPSHDRKWEFGFEKLPMIHKTDDTVTIRQVRDYRYVSDKQTGYDYITRTIPVQKIERVWFVIEPFPLKDLGFEHAVAHTYFVFDIQGEEPIAVSVEARREKGEQYDAFKGMFNAYELIYVWASEKDITGRRILLEHNNVYMYPVQIPQKEAQALFVQMAETTHRLETTPRFYNTLTSNCTNELAKNANTVQEGIIPLNISLFLPGYADKKIYEYGLIPHDKPFEEIKKEYFISELVTEYYAEEHFSKKLRDNLRH